MQYWNDGNFKGLIAIAAEAGESAELRDFSEYCRLREAGMRRQAFAALGRFIALAAAWTDDDRRRFVEWIMAIRERHPEVHHLLPQPLLSAVVFPTLEAWSSKVPEAGTPLRCLGILRNDSALLRKAITLDPHDDVSRKHFVTILLEDVEFSTHHLVEGQFIGSVSEAMMKLDEAEKELRALTNMSARQQLETWAGSLRILATDWHKYQESKASEPFPDWCKRQGRTHKWWSIVYYDK